MAVFWRALFVALVLIGGAHVFAQQKPIDVQQRIAPVAQRLDEISRSVREDENDDLALLKLRGEIDPLNVRVQEVIDELQPQLDAARQQLEQFGPKPDGKEKTESEETARARAAQQKAVDDLDAQMRRTRVVSVRLTQVAGEITNARRELLLGEIFKQTSSALNPLLWYDAAREMPRVYRTGAFYATDWWSRIAERLHGARLLRFLAAVFLLALAYYLLRRALRALARRERPEAPTELEKTGVALMTAGAIAVLPFGAAWIFVEILRGFDLVTSLVQPFVTALLDAVRMIAVGVGLARGVLSPGRPQWRLVDLPDVVARRFNTLAVNFISIAALLHVAEAFNQIVTAPLDVSVASRALLTTLGAGVLAYSIFGSARLSRQIDAELGPRIEKRDWFAFWRVAIWGAIIAVIGANAFGYVNFANFLVTQIMWVTFVLMCAFLLHSLLSQAIARIMQPTSMFASAASTALGVRASALKQLSILLSGLVTLLVYLVGAMLILAPWGVESDSVFDTMKAAFFGFSFGAINFSLSGLVIAIVLFALGFIATRAFQRWLEGSYLPSTELDSGLQNSITTSAGYIGVITAIVLPFAYLGFNFEKLAIVAGALSLGIGFGLQSIVSNFVSGLILLWERAIKVGDWVVVGAEQGIVKRINVRSTEIETFERQTVIVPNSNLISGVVKNWVRGDRSGRITVEVGVDYNSDPEVVRQILLDCAGDNPNVAKLPEPSVLFTAFADSSLNFELRCFVEDVQFLGSTRSDLRFEIFRRFKAANINIPFPQSDVTVRSLDRLVDLMAHQRLMDSGPSASDAGPTSAPGTRSSNAQ